MIDSSYTIKLKKTAAEVDVIDAIGTDNKMVPYLRMDLIDDFNKVVEICKEKVLALKGGEHESIG